MGNVEGNLSATSNRSMPHMSNNSGRDCQSEVRDLLETLGSWGENSQREFSNIVHSRGHRINKAMNDLVKEVSDLHHKLSDITKERDGLLEEVDDLRDENMQLREKHVMEIPLYEERDEERQKANSKTDESCYVDKTDPRIEYMGLQEDHTNDSTIYEMASDSDINDADVESKKELKYLKQEKDYSEDHPNGNLDFSTTQNLSIRLKNINPKMEIREESSLSREQTDLTRKINENEPFNDRKEPIGKKEQQKSKVGVMQCDHCHYETACKRNLSRHIQGVHLKIKKHVCKECDKAFTQKVSLRLHIEGVHENVRNHPCGQCGHAAKGKNALNKHIEAVHDKIRNHVCIQCGYSATLKGDLKKHIEGVHENIRNHICGECGYAFKAKGSLKQHMWRMHVEKDSLQ